MVTRAAKGNLLVGDTKTEKERTSILWSSDKIIPQVFVEKKNNILFSEDGERGREEKTTEKICETAAPSEYKSDVQVNWVEVKGQGSKKWKATRRRDM